MSADLATLGRGLDLTEEHIARAIEARDDTRALLAHMAAISLPNSGTAKVLLVYARLATTACDWLDGDLGVELTSDGDATVIDALTELGGGLRERLFPPLRFQVPLFEFERAIRRVPHMVAPLVIRSATARRIRLGVTELVRRTTAPPPAIVISNESLFVRGTPHGVPFEALEEVPEALEPLAAEEDIVILPMSEPPLPTEPPEPDVDEGWEG